MKNRANHPSFIPSILTNLTVTCLTNLTLIAGITRQADAASVINFDAATYDYSNTNTCTPQLPDTGGKCFIEDGFNVEAFSAQEIGTTSAFFSDHAHFHASHSYEGQHFSAVNKLLGVYLTSVNGSHFSLESLDYQFRDASNIIDGFGMNDIKILISTKFDPTMAVKSQFMEYSIGNDTTLPFQPLEFSEFENINQVYIASSAGVNFDNITVNAVPEPLTILGTVAAASLGTVFQRELKKNKNKR